MSAASRAAPPASPTARWLFAAVALAAVLWLFRGLALPLLLAALGAYFAHPIVVRFEEQGVRRGPVVIALFALVTVVLVVAGTVVAPSLRAQSTQLVERLPQFSDRLESVATTARASLSARLPLIADELPVPAPGWPERLLSSQKRHAAALVSGAGAVLFVLVLAPVFGFFLLRDGPRMLDGLVRLVPPRHIETSVAIWCELDRIIGRYLRGLILESLGVAVLATVGLALLGVPAPLVLGAFAGLVNPVPYIGVLLSFGVAALTALASGMSADILVALVVLFGGIRLIDDFVLIPLALGGSVHLHPALVIAAILAGEQTLGVVGMVIAVPLVTIVKEVARLLLEAAGSPLGRRARAEARAAAVPYLC